MMTGHLFNLLAQLVGTNYLTLNSFSYHPHGVLFALLHEDGSARASALRTLRSWFETLRGLQDAAATSVLLRSALQKCLWPDMESYMELMWELAEWNFEEVP